MEVTVSSAQTGCHEFTPESRIRKWRHFETVRAKTRTCPWEEKGKSGEALPLPHSSVDKRREAAEDNTPSGKEHGVDAHIGPAASVSSSPSPLARRFVYPAFPVLVPQ